MIDALVNDEKHESLKDEDGDNGDNNVEEDTRSVHTKSSVFSSSNFSTAIGVFDDGSVTTAGGGGARHNQKHNRIPFHAVHKRTTPNLVRKRRYTQRHGGGGRLEESFGSPSTFFTRSCFHCKPQRDLGEQRSRGGRIRQRRL